MRKTDLSHAEFCSLCSDAIRDLFRDAITEQGNSIEEIRVRRESEEPITIFLSNLWSRTRNNADGRTEEIERFLGAMIRVTHAKPAATQHLRPLAIENLRRILPPVLQHGDGPVYMLTAGADYVASLMLFDDIWDEIQESIEGDIVAAVPSRDKLLFTDSSSKTGIEELRSSITGITNGGGYLVSSAMFRRTPDGWKPFS